MYWENVKRTAVEKHKEIIESRIQDMNLSCVIHQSWGNVSVSGDWNPTHSHTGMISGVGYLRLPDDIDKEWEDDYKDHFPSNGHINFSYGVDNKYGCANMLIKPRVGDFFVFPNYLFHCVYPFYTKGERRSFSMNMTFYKQIIN